jgi:release factor glutamine methyltransferase
MDALQEITRCAGKRLRPEGWLLLEHGYDQAEALTRLLQTSGYEQVCDYPDTAGLGRVVAGQWPFPDGSNG